MVPKILRTLPGVFLLLLGACNKSVTIAGSAEGYGGGDNDIAAVENARLAAVATIKGIRDGEMTDPICQIPICVGTSCAAVRSISEEQRQFLVRELTDRAYVEKLLTVLDDPKAFKVSDTAILINGKEVDAVTKLGEGKVVLNRKRLNNVLKIEIISLLVHESMHAVAFPYDGDGLLSDEEAISDAGTVLFTSGRQLADLTGACVALHEERELIAESIASIGSAPPRGVVDSGSETGTGGTLLPIESHTPSSEADSEATSSPSPTTPPAPTAAPAESTQPVPTNLPPTPTNLPPLPPPPNVSQLPPLPSGLPPLPSGFPSFPLPIRVPGR